MRATGAKGVAGRGAATLLAFLIVSSAQAEAAEDGVCQVIADAIASQAGWAAHDIANIGTEAGHVKGIDEIRAALQTIDPALLEALTPSIDAKPGAVGWWLSQADIDGDGSAEWWLKSNQGSAYCETSSFYRSAAPYAFMGRIGSLEGDCGFHAKPVAVDGEPYILLTDYGAELEYPQYDLLQWRAPEQIELVCRVRTLQTGDFKTETDCEAAEQPVCDAIAALAAPLIRTDDTALAGAVVTDAAILRTLSFRKHSDTLVQYADIDNDGADEIFATESSRSSPVFSFDDFRFVVLPMEQDGPSLIDPNTTYAGFEAALDPYDYNPAKPGFYGTRLRALFPVRIDARTFLVQRARSDRDEPGDFKLRILIIEDGRARRVGLVYATPVLRGEIEMAP